MKKTIALLTLICMLMSVLVLTSCSKGDSAGDLMGGYAPGMGDGYYGSTGCDYDASAPEGGDEYAPDGADKGDTGSSTPEENVKLPAGMITAAAWNDNDYYNDWLALFSQDGDGKFFGYTNAESSWGYNSLDRVTVSVLCADQPIKGAQVVAYDLQGNKLFGAVTDSKGNAYLFPNEAEGTVSVTYGDESVTVSFTKDERELDVALNSNAGSLNVIEIMLVVDVTGSMSDEISFLKAELADVINRIADNDTETVIRLAMLFYRDTDDSVPFAYYDFVDVTTPDGLSKQQTALDSQWATGGGDYPEAVDEALDIAVNKQWSTGAATKIIFQVLDAPAHNTAKNKQKLENAVNSAAEKGIRFCPIICSGASTETEYTMREAAIHTGGTFVFVTDDSGIGSGHHDPGLPNATVELLNSLMVRLVNGYHTGVFDNPVYWKQDPGLGTSSNS